MSFNVTLSIPINTNDNYVKKVGQASNAMAPQSRGDNRPSPYPNPIASDTPDANVAQIINDFRPVKKVVDPQLPIDEFMGGFPWNVPIRIT